MVRDIRVLWGKKDSTKDLVFRILISDYPLKLIELTNLIKKRYGKSITFQAVRQAVFELIEDHVLGKKGKEFQISSSWLLEAKKTLAHIEEKLICDRSKSKDFKSVGGEFSSFNFETLNEMIIFWQNLIDDWYKNFKKGDYPYNCWQGQHLWEALLHLDAEKKVMVQLKKKGIKSYALVYSNYPLDTYIRKFYSKIGLAIKNIPSRTEFDNTYYVGTYGDLIIQAKYPKKLVNDIDDFFKKTKSLEDMDINALHEITSTKSKIKLVIMKNSEMAKQINKTIIEEFE